MKPALYVETSIISYLTARQSRDIVTAAQQEITRDLYIAVSTTSGMDYLLT